MTKDPDVNFLHDNVSAFDTNYISSSNFNENFKDFLEHSLCSISQYQEYK